MKALQESPSVFGKAYRKVQRDWRRIRRRSFKRWFPFLQTHWHSDVNLSRPPRKVAASIMELPEGSAVIELLRPPTKFRRDLPIVEPGEKLLPEFGDRDYDEGAEYVGALTSGRVYGPATVLTKEHTLLARESFEFNVFRERDRDIYGRFWLPKLRYLEGTVASVASEDIQNYHHWMFFTVPRIGLVLQSTFAQEQPKFLINRLTRPFHFETFELLSIPLDRVLFAEDYPYVEVAKLLVGPAPVPTRHSQFSVDFVRQAFKPQVSRKDRCIYVGRGQTRTRRCVNEDELVKALSSMGFDCMTMDGLTLAEQAKIFAESKIVIAPHGAAMTNIVFMDPGAAVLELTHHNIRFFWDLACKAGLRYSHMPSQLVPGANDKVLPLQYDFRVDIEGLQKRLSLLLEKEANLGEMSG